MPTKPAYKSPPKPKKGNVKVTSNSVVFSLGPAEKELAKQCLAKTGRITLGFKEVSVTKLGGLANAIVTVN